MANVRPRVIFGASSLGGLYDLISEATAEECVRCAIEDYGVEEFDTAPHYGCGSGERRLGDILARGSIGFSAKVWTKVGRRMIPRPQEVSVELAADKRIEWSNVHGSKECVFPGADPTVLPVIDYTAVGILSSYAQSQERLQLHSIHGLRVHDCDTDERLKELLEGGGLEALINLRNSVGVKLSIGTNSSIYALKLLDKAEFDSLLIANQWNLLDHPQETVELFQKCTERGVEIHVAGVFASGILASQPTALKRRYQYSDDFDAIVSDKVRRWHALAASHNLPLAAVALHFVATLLPFSALQHKLVVGFKNADEVRECFINLSATVPLQLWKDARDQCLIADNACRYLNL